MDPGYRRGGEMAQHRVDRPSEGSLHRILIVRIAAVTAGICIVLAVLVYMIERARFDQALVDSTLHTVANLRGVLIDQLDAPHLGDHSKIRETIGKFSAYVPRGANGRYVFARIIDTGYSTVAQELDPAYAHQPAVDRYLDGAAQRDGEVRLLVQPAPAGNRTVERRSAAANR